jgi:hypothetical protein
MTDEKKLSTGLTVVAFIIGVVGLVMSIMIMVGYEYVIGSAITLTMILMAVAGGVALLFGLYQLVTNIKKNISLLIGIVGFVILAVVCYMLASDEVLRSYVDITPTVSKLSGAGLLLMYVLIIGATVAAIFSEVSRIFK